MTKTVQKSKARDMTQGSIWKQLLLFSLPLMAGNLFQQLYNTVDSIVVGNFVGKEALAAVGSVGPIINSLIGFFMGLSTGAGVIISQYYGAKADEKVSRTVSTTLVMTFFLSIVFNILGIFLTPYLLRSATIAPAPPDINAAAVIPVSIAAGDAPLRRDVWINCSAAAVRPACASSRDTEYNIRNVIYWRAVSFSPIRFTRPFTSCTERLTASNVPAGSPASSII